MCGIAGVVKWDGGLDGCERHVAAMIRSIRHRGPDHDTVLRFDNAVLGHARLAIIDLDPSSNQPFVDSDENLVIVFNGEIYNFKELRAELVARGHTFRTRGDTEVVLTAYKEWGPDAVTHLNGMFAYAIIDHRERRVVMARDRTGEKPLVFKRLPNGGVVFASDLNALRRYPGVGNEVNPVAVGHFLALNYTMADESITQGTEKLRAGHMICFGPEGDSGQLEYWDLACAFQQKNHDISFDDAQERLQELLLDSVRMRMISDVPLGAFLSGGIDSSSVVAAMAKSTDPEKIKTFSIGFKEEGYSEVLEARSIAAYVGVDHSDKTVVPKMADILEKICAAYDEPFADISMIPQYFLSSFARKDVTVALSGDGGDELFGGYVTYLADQVFRSLKRIVPTPVLMGASHVMENHVPAKFGKLNMNYKLRQFLRGSNLDWQSAHVSWRNIFREEEKQKIINTDKLQAITGTDPFEYAERHFSRVSDCNYLDQAMYVDIKTWLVDDILVKVDRATMAHSLECRAPFLDHRLIEFAASLPVDFKLSLGRTKHILRQSQKGHIPEKVRKAPKKGFAAPAADWLAGSLLELGRDVTTSRAMAEWFQVDKINELWDEHVARRRDNGFRLYGLICLGMWLQQNRSHALQQ